MPQLALECIASWRKFLPDYEIWMWVETEFANANANANSQFADKVMPFDVNIIPYTEEAYKQKKYAFVSDYARFWIMYKYGGIYFDTDVEVIRPMDDIIARGNFMGFEMDPDGENTPGKYAPSYCYAVNPGLGFGVEAENGFINEMIGLYSSLQFSLELQYPWFKTVVAYTTEILCQRGLENKKGNQQVCDITIYPSEYFAPIKPVSGRIHITENTRTIHRYMGSWAIKSDKSLKKSVRSCLPECVLVAINKIKRNKYKIR